MPADLRAAPGESCIARPIDIRASAKPDEMIDELLRRVAHQEASVLALLELAEKSAPDQRRGTERLAASAARAADALRKRVERLRTDLEVRALVDQMVGGGDALGELLDRMADCIFAHDERISLELSADTLRRSLVASGAARDDRASDGAASLPKTVSRGVRTARVRKSRPPVRSHPATPVTPCAEALAADYTAHRALALAAVAGNNGGMRPTIRTVDPGPLGEQVQAHLRRLIELKRRDPEDDA
jgi:hypothetical protein